MLAKHSDMDNAEQPIVLATTDFTEISDYAIDHAATMAKILNGKVLLLHVIDKYTHRMLKREGKPESYVNEKLESIREQIKENHGVESIVVVKKGKIFQVISEVGKAYDALLHFLGTHGKKGIQWIVGSFALKVVKKSQVPVVVIQQPAGNINYKHIVYPLDPLPGSKQKVKWAKILHRAAGSHFDIFIDNYGDGPTDRKLRADLNQICEILKHNNIPYETHCARPSGSFGLQVVEFAKKQQADAIMITSDPDKLTCNPFNKEEERVMYNKEKIPVMFINSKNLSLLIGGP